MAFDEFGRDPPRLVQIAAPDPELPVHHRRIIKDEVFLATRRSVAVDQLERRFRQRLGQLLRIGDRCRPTNELRLRTVELADAPQPAQHVGQVAAIDAAIVVQLIDHDVAQVFEALRPFGVMRQNAAVQHVGIGEHHVGPLADRLAGRPAACRHRR